jgi:hypothetical protein
MEPLGLAHHQVEQGDDVSLVGDAVHAGHRQQGFGGDVAAHGHDDADVVDQAVGDLGLLTVQLDNVVERLKERRADTPLQLGGDTPHHKHHHQAHHEGDQRHQGQFYE